VRASLVKGRPFTQHGPAHRAPAHASPHPKNSPSPQSPSVARAPLSPSRRCATLPQLPPRLPDQRLLCTLPPPPSPSPSPSAAEPRWGAQPLSPPPPTTAAARSEIRVASACSSDWYVRTRCSFSQSGSRSRWVVFSIRMPNARMRR
jgi:hypothetical protein